MEIIVHGHTTEVDDLSWRSDILNVRKRILSIVRRGGLLDTVLDDANRNGEIDYHHLTKKYLDFESICNKLVEDLTEEEKKHHLEGIDIEAEFTARYELLGIPKVERVHLSLYVIDNIRRWEEKKILFDETKGAIKSEEVFERLLNYLELTHPKLKNIDDEQTRNNLMCIYEEIQLSFSQSLDEKYLNTQQKLIKEIVEKLNIHLQLVDLMKKIALLQTNESTSLFLRAGLEMIEEQRESMIENIEKIDNSFIYSPIHSEFDALGEDLEYLMQKLH
jgi:hypothetical protein